MNGSPAIVDGVAYVADDETTTVTATVENTGGMGTLQTAEHRLADDTST